MSQPRGLRAAWTIKSEDVNVNTTFNITLTTVSATRIDAEIAIGSTGRYGLRFWLVDDTASPNDRTLDPPSEDDTVDWQKVTDADGTYTHSINNTVAGKTWYLVAEWAGQVVFSAAISF